MAEQKTVTRPDPEVWRALLGRMTRPGRRGKYHVAYGATAIDQLCRALADATDSDEVERAADQLEFYLRWYDPRTACVPVRGRALSPNAAFSITVPPLRYYFEVDDTVRPFIMRVVRVEWVLALTHPSDDP